MERDASSDRGDTLRPRPTILFEVIGHALVHAPRHAVHPVSERWVAAGFAVGSLCFFVGALMLARHHGGTTP